MRESPMAKKKIRTQPGEVITGAAGFKLACVNENRRCLVCQFFFFLFFSPPVAPKWFAHEKLGSRANNDCKWSCM